MDWLIGTLGARGAAALLALGALAALAVPLLTWRDRRGWTPTEARVDDISARRSLASSTWAIQVSFEADGKPRSAIVPVNLVRRPLAVGDTITILRHPRYPGRVAVTPWQGAGTGLMVAAFLALGAIAASRS